MPHYRVRPVDLTKRSMDDLISAIEDECNRLCDEPTGWKLVTHIPVHLPGHPNASLEEPSILLVFAAD